jgi:hypothetical protein
MRLWLKPWIWVRWPCPGCGAMLRFDPGRRVVVAILLVLVVMLAGVMGRMLEPLWGTPAGWLITAAGFLLVIPVLLLDAVTLA